MGRIRTDFEKSIDARHEGFEAKDAMWEHNAEKSKAIHKSVTTKVGLKMYSDKELADKGGPVVEYNYNNPYTWKEFKAMPEINKREYLSHLRQKYNGISCNDLAQMFGVSMASVNAVATKFGMVPFAKCSYKSNEAKEAKARFEAEMLDKGELVVSETVTQPDVVDYILLSASFTCDAEYVASTVRSLGMTGMVRVSVEMI